MLPGGGATHGVDSVDELAGLAELDEALLEVVEGPLDQHPVLLVEAEEVVPQGLLGQHLGVAHNDNAVAGTGQGHIQTPGVVQEADALVLVGAHARHHNQVLLPALEGTGSETMSI